MVLIYLTDLIPILISCLVFSLLAMAHRILLPNKYSAFLQFEEEEDVSRTIQSTSIRVIYLIMGTCFLNLALGFSEKQIDIGVLVACFLNVWPAIIQNQLLKLHKNKTEWLILAGYLLFIVTSLFIGMFTVRLFIPLLQGDITVYWLDNQAITILVSLLLISFPITLEAILAKFTRIVVVQTIDTFLEEVYILEHQLNMKCSLVEKNKFLIDKVARENDINVILLETILRLEIFYRGRLYNRVLEKIICRYFSWIAIKKDITVGIAQIKISTAEKVLRESSQSFIKKICDDTLNIEICAKLLKNLINQYGDMIERNSYNCGNYKDIYDYIACEYLGSFAWKKDKVSLIYSSVLRSFMKEEQIYYAGAEQTGRCLVCVHKTNIKGIDYDLFQELLEKMGEDVMVRKKVFVEEYELALEFICNDKRYIGMANQFAKKYKCEFAVYDK